MNLETKVAIGEHVKHMTYVEKLREMLSLVHVCG